MAASSDEIGRFALNIYQLGSAIPPRGWVVGQLGRLGGRGAEGAREQKSKSREVWRRVAIWAWIGQKCNTFAKFALQLLNVFAASIGEVCNCRQKQGVDGCVKIARSQD